MKSLTGVWALFCLLFLGLVLAGPVCGGDDDDNDDDNDSQTDDDTGDDDESPTDDDTGDDDTGSAGKDDICQIMVDCQFWGSVDQCITSYFESCTGENWDEQGALDCINDDCLPNYEGGQQDCADYVVCVETCIYDEFGCL